MRTVTAHRTQASETDQMISRTVKGILAFTSMPPDAFWHTVGLSRSTYYNRINGETPWSADDVQRAADALGVAVADLYDGRVPQGLPRWAGVTAGLCHPDPDFLAPVVDLALFRLAG